MVETILTKPTRRSFPTIDLLGVPLSAIRLGDLLAFMQTTLDSGDQAVILYANLHTLNLASQLPRIRQVLQNANVLYCDGVGVRIAARLMGGSLPQRFTLPDWIGDLCHLCVERGYSMYLLGGVQGVAARAAEILQSQHADLRIAGTHHGYFDHTPNSPENLAVLSQIADAQPSILLVCLGSPLQEYWIDTHRDALNVPVILSGGAVMDYLIGRVPRAPRLLTDHGLEWLGRLLMEPRRLWKRYLIGVPSFFARLLISRLRLPDK